jgi:hypothetical protein
MKKTILILTALASLTIANAYANEAQLVDALKQAGIVRNGVMTVTDQNKDLVLRLIRKYAPERLPGVQREMSSWQYLNPGYGVFGYRDRNGVMHTFQSDMDRYNTSTREFRFQ